MSPLGRTRWPRSAKLLAITLVALLAAIGVGAIWDRTEPSDTSLPSTDLPSHPEDTALSASTTRPTQAVPSDNGTTAPGATDSRAEVDLLVIAEPDPELAPYRRDAFGDGWDYDPSTGCNTRELVLIEEAVRAPTVDDRCRSTNGEWRSAYDGVTVTDVADLQIDHFVPLADAWRSGADSWTDERRREFANDVTHPETLIAVTGQTNQSKSDSTPDHWLPPDQSAWCTYATDWVSVKVEWSLTVTPAEKSALVQVLSGC